MAFTAARLSRRLVYPREPILLLTFTRAVAVRPKNVAAAASLDRIVSQRTGIRCRGGNDVDGSTMHRLSGR